jgi:hypothetical protein
MSEFGVTGLYVLVMDTLEHESEPGSGVHSQVSGSHRQTWTDARDLCHLQ